MKLANKLRFPPGASSNCSVTSRDYLCLVHHSQSLHSSSSEQRYAKLRLQPCPPLDLRRLWNPSFGLRSTVLVGVQGPLCGGVRLLRPNHGPAGLLLKSMMGGRLCLTELVGI